MASSPCAAPKYQDFPGKPIRPTAILKYAIAAGMISVGLLSVVDEPLVSAAGYYTYELDYRNVFHLTLLTILGAIPGLAVGIPLAFLGSLRRVRGSGRSQARLICWLAPIIAGAEWFLAGSSIAFQPFPVNHGISAFVYGTVAATTAWVAARIFVRRALLPQPRSARRRPHL